VKKGQEGANVKACNDFGNDPMKMCSEHKIRLKVATYFIIKLNILKYIYHSDSDFGWKICFS
jgi:hypothetical protein